MHQNHQETSLSKKVMKGGLWIFSSRGIHQIVFLIKISVLAHLLEPRDFGIMGIAMLTMATINTFTQTGFHHAIIQKKDEVKDYLNPAWTILIIRGFLLFIMLYLLAPHASRFFQEPNATLIIQVIGLSTLLNAFTNIGVVYFQKDLEFNKRFVFQTAGRLTELAVSLAAAFIFKNVWALVLGDFAANLVRVVLNYFIHPYRPKLQLDIQKTKELFRFGKWVLGSTVLFFFLGQGDDFFVGKLLGATALGFYQMAYKISNIPATEVSEVISNISFPTYSKLQEKRNELMFAYFRFLRVTLFLALPVTGLIILLAGDLTPVLLGEKWLPIVPALQILCFYGLTRTWNTASNQVFLGIGKPKITTFGAVFQLGLMVILIYPFTAMWGIVGTSGAVVIPSMFYLVYVNVQLSRTFRVKIKQLVEPLVLPGVFALILCGIIILQQVLWKGSLIGMALFTLLGILISFSVTYFIDKVFYADLLARFKGLRD